MKTASFFALALVALVQSSSSLLSLASANELESEFLSWKASPAGQAAYRNGHVPGVDASPASSRLLERASEHDDTVAPPTLDELTRFQNAKDTIAKLQQEQPSASFSLNTPFALLTPDEFAAYVNKNGIQGHRELLEKHIGPDRFVNTTRPTDATVRRQLEAAANVVDVDWATKGCVNAPQDQGQCGASWAFSTVAALEGGYCAKTGTLLALSAQDVISCGTNGQGSCSNGVSSRAYDWISHLNGGSVCTDATYPYASASGQAPACPRDSDANFNCDKPDLGAYFYEAQNFADHTKLEAVVLERPVSTLATTGVSTFQYYTSGIIMGNEDACPSKKLDSAILIVGYGTLDGVAYWKVRNQWSTYWGDQGYAYVQRGYQGAPFGACGVETLAYYPVFTSSSNAGVNLRCSAQRERVEILGATLKSVPAVKPQDCCDKCRQESGCKAYVWRYESDTCELKSSVTGETANAAGANPTYSGTVMSKNERIQQGTILNNVDFAGNDILSTRAATAEDCLDKCNEYLNCHAFSWTQRLGGSCYLKSKRPAVATSAQPAADGSPYIRSGTSYKCTPLLGNTDNTGKDIAGVLAATPQECCGLCRATSPCGAFSWSNYNGGTCWLKEAGGATVAATDVHAASLH